MTKKSIKLHLKNDDYFGTLATIIRLIREDPDIKRNINSLKNIEDDLIFLQKNYKIIKSTKKFLTQ